MIVTTSTHQRRGQVTQVNRLAIEKIGGRECVVNDVALREGVGLVRMVTRELMAGDENRLIQWLFYDHTRLKELAPVVETVLKTLILDTSQAGQGKDPAKIDTQMPHVSNQ